MKFHLHRYLCRRALGVSSSNPLPPLSPQQDLVKAQLSLLVSCRQAGVGLEQQLSGLSGEAAFLQRVCPAACGAAVSGSAGDQAPLEASEARRAPAGAPSRQHVAFQSDPSHAAGSRSPGQSQAPAVAVASAAAGARRRRHGPDAVGGELAQTGSQLRPGCGAESAARCGSGGAHAFSAGQRLPFGGSLDSPSDGGLSGGRVPEPAPVSLPAKEERRSPPRDAQ